MDQIANMLIKLKNAQVAGRETVSFYHSKFKMEILKILLKEKYIAELDKKGKKIKTIEVVLKYDEKGNPAISHVKKISKLSRRIYVPAKKIKLVRGGFGMQILSTPKGVLTDKEARKEKVGGELICEIW